MNMGEIRTSPHLNYTNGEFFMVPELLQQVRHPGYEDRVGTVIELDQPQSRARVKWSDKRTWIAFKRLRLV